MSLEVVALAVATALLPAVALWLSYRDYLRSHRAFVAAVCGLQETAPLPADAIAALSPAPPLRQPLRAG